MEEENNAIEPTESDNFNDALSALQGEEEVKPSEIPEDKVVQEATETPKEEVQEAEKPSEGATALYKALTEQDRELRQLRKQVKQGASSEDLEAMAKKDPEAFLQKFGLTFDRVFDIWASKPEQSKEQSTGQPVSNEWQKKVDVLEQKLAQQEERNSRAAADAAYERDLGTLQNKAASDISRWHFVNKAKKQGSLNLAFQVAGQIYEQTGQAPEFESVLDEVEKHMEKEARQSSEWLNEKNPSKPPEPQKSIKQEESIPTLSGSLGDTEAPKELTDDECRALALKELEKGYEDE